VLGHELGVLEELGGVGVLGGAFHLPTLLLFTVTAAMIGRFESSVPLKRLNSVPLKRLKRTRPIRSRSLGLAILARNRILFTKDEWGGGFCIPVSDERVQHIHGVLRASPGDRIKVGIVDEGIGEADIISIGPDVFTAQLSGPLRPPPPTPRVSILLACPRPKVVRRLFEKMAQMGVDRIVVTTAAKVEKGYLSAHQFSPASVESQVLKGLEQAGDCIVPLILSTKSLKCALRLVQGDLENTWGWTLLTGDITRPTPPAPATQHQKHQKHLKLLCHPDESIPYLSEELVAWKSLIESGGRITFAVGPEGGWTDEELALFEVDGWRRVKLGPRVLTTDVAIIAMMAQAGAFFAD